MICVEKISRHNFLEILRSQAQKKLARSLLGYEKLGKYSKETLNDEIDLYPVGQSKASLTHL